MAVTESFVTVFGERVSSLLKDGTNYVALRPMLEALNRGLTLSAGWSAETGASVKAGEDA